MSDIPEELQSLPIPPTLGAGFIGFFLSAVFYGVTLLQAYQYFITYWKEDTIFLRSFVAFLMILDTLGVLTTMHFMWFFLIDNYGNRAALLTVSWSLVVFLVVTSLVGFLVQVFYAYRIWVLGGRKIWMPLIIVILALGCLAVGITYIAFIYSIGTMLAIPAVTFLSTISLACAFASDALIAGSMISHLMKGRQQGMTRTKSTVKKLIVYTINTGVVTTACTIVALLVGQILIDTFYNTIFYFPLNNCYLNSMLAFLNARQALRAGNNVSFQLSSSGQGPTVSANQSFTRVGHVGPNKPGTQYPVIPEEDASTYVKPSAIV